MSWYVVVGAVAVGFASGVLSGMFGIGGAVLTTPGIRLLGATPIQAVGSTVPAILPGALSGTYRYARAGLVNWRIGLICGFTGSALAVMGAWTAGQVDARWLMVLTAVLLGWSGVSILRSGRSRALVAPDVADAAAGAVASPAPSSGPAPSRIPTFTLIVVGAASGFLAGRLGVGGGVVMMPMFTSVLRIPIKEAVASSLVAVAIFSIPALVTHASLGHIHWGFAACLVVGAVPGAQVGSRLTIGAPDRTVRTLFGILLVVLAVVYGGSELVALLT
jgi:uncharacterized protein